MSKIKHRNSGYNIGSAIESTFCLIQCPNDPLMWESDTSFFPDQAASSSLSEYILAIFDMAWPKLPCLARVAGNDQEVSFVRTCGVPHHNNDDIKAKDSSDDDALYWRVLDYLWESCRRGELNPLDFPFTGAQDVIASLPYKTICHFIRNTACQWMTTPQELPCTFDEDEDSWENLLRKGRVVIWDTPHGSGTRTWLTPSPSSTGVSVYDIEWLIVKWSKDLSYYDNDIGTVMPRYPRDELNRIIHPDKIIMVVNRYINYRKTYPIERCACGMQTLIQPLWLLSSNPEGRYILECVYELTSAIDESGHHQENILAILSRRRKHALPDIARLLWEDNHCVQVSHDQKRIVFYPHALLSTYLSRSMMWMHGREFCESRFWKFVWESMWSTRVYKNPATEKRFLGDLVLTDAEKTDPDFVHMLRTMRKDASRSNNWARLRTVTAHKNRLALIVRTRWTTVLNVWRSVTHTCRRHKTKTNDDGHDPAPPELQPFFEDFQWIDENHIRHHAEKNANAIVRETSRGFLDIYSRLSKRNTCLWESSNFMYPDEQEKPLDHLSYLDPDRIYPDLHKIVTP